MKEVAQSIEGITKGISDVCRGSDLNIKAASGERFSI